MSEMGNVFISPRIRQAIDLAPGDLVDVSIDKSGEVITLKKYHKEDGESTIDFTETGWPFLNVGISLPKDFDTVAFIKEAREERMNKLMGLSPSEEE